MISGCYSVPFTQIDWIDRIGGGLTDSAEYLILCARRRWAVRGRAGQATPEVLEPGFTVPGTTIEPPSHRTTKPPSHHENPQYPLRPARYGAIAIAIARTTARMLNKPLEIETEIGH